MESDRIHAAGAIMREAVDHDDAPGAEQGWLRWLRANGIPGDRRRRHPRARAPHPRRGRDARRDLRRRRAGGRGARARARRAEHGRPRPRARGDGRASRALEATGGGPRDRRARHRHQALDHPQLHRARRDARALPVHDAGRASCWPATPTASSSSPARATRRRSDYIVDTIRTLLSRKPVFGICLGHQLLSRAAGLETFKLPFGHRGANHPVKDLRTGRIAITSQNHGFAVGGRGRRADRVRARRRRAHPREPLRRHGRGHPAARRPRRLRPVPPGGRPRAERLARPLRRVHRRAFDRAALARRPPARSSCSAPGRS